MVAATTAAARTAAYRATIIITISNYPTVHLRYFLNFLEFRLMYRHSGSVAIPASNYVLKILEKILMNVLCWLVRQRNKNNNVKNVENDPSCCASAVARRPPLPNARERQNKHPEIVHLSTKTPKPECSERITSPCLIHGRRHCPKAPNFLALLQPQNSLMRLLL